MSADGQEIEAKFYVRDLARIQNRLERLGARVQQERVLETNIRFDLPGSPLRAEGRVLRLRRDTQARMTYKGSSRTDQGVMSRVEVEFVVEDFEKARRLIEALGYQKLFSYEKYRAIYDCDPLLVMLDELPYGDFVEIEGPSVGEIRALAERIGLNPDAAVSASYHQLFERARQALRLDFADLLFAHFENIRVREADLQVDAADQ